MSPSSDSARSHDGELILRLALIGLPGSGKSTIGRLLARRLSLPFFDSDHVIEQQLGCSIRSYFEAEGEDAFRQVESDVIERLTDGEPCVLSTGGGVVLREVNRTRLIDTCLVIHLHATPEDLYTRLRHDLKRPLLQVADPLAKLRSLDAERGPLYRATAHLTVETGRDKTHHVVDTIVAQLPPAAQPPATPPPGP